MQQRPWKSRLGFTLVELLVVIGIIVILIGILLPVLSKVMRQGVGVRIRSDLNAIETALEAYKQDFGDYPRIIYFAGGGTMNGTGSGADLLGKALLGPGGATAVAFSSSVPYSPGIVVSNGNYFYSSVGNVAAGNTPAAGSTAWQIITVPSALDGADGLGERVRAGGYGQIYGPYLNIDKFKTRGLSLLDYVGNPILYFPGNPAKPVVTAALATAPASGNTLVSVPTGSAPGAAPIATVPSNSVSLFNYSDNDATALNAISSLPGNAQAAFPGTGSLGLNVMLAMLGDYNKSGFSDIANGDIAFTPRPYLLWSAGPDGLFGPKEANPDPTNFVNVLTAGQRKTAVGKCDDVTNFTLGQ